MTRALCISISMTSCLCQSRICGGNNSLIDKLEETLKSVCERLPIQKTSSSQSQGFVLAQTAESGFHQRVALGSD
jgi:hypothetical protein